jgi:stringent starvation protein B
MSEPGEPRPPQSASQLPPKREVAIALLQTNSVFVQLDPRHAEVRVPPWFKKQPRLVLQIGLNMAVPIRDLDVGEAALSCTLSFNRQPFFCFIPWRAVFALVNEEGRGMVWPDDVPRELVADAEKQREVAQRRSRLRAVAAPDAQASPTPDEEAGASSENQAPGHSELPSSSGRADPPAARTETEADRKPPVEAEAASPGPSADRQDSRADAEGSSSDEPRPTEPASEAEPRSKPEPSSKKTRSLPPYLRVVK